MKRSQLNSRKQTSKTLIECVESDACINTDESPSYSFAQNEFATHHAVNHKKGEYIRGNAHVDTAESVHALLKRGIIGTFHHAQRQGKRQHDNKVAVSPSRPLIC